MIVAVADTATTVSGTGEFAGLSFTTDDVTTASGTIEVENILGDIDRQLNNLLRVRAGLGARMNRVELTANRLADDDVYRASLSTGAKVIQPSLVDYLS